MASPRKTAAKKPVTAKKAVRKPVKAAPKKRTVTESIGDRSLRIHKKLRGKIAVMPKAKVADEDPGGGP